MRSSQQDLTERQKPPHLEGGTGSADAILAKPIVSQKSKHFNCLRQNFLTFLERRTNALDARIVEAVGRMHVARITGQMLAKESGYNASYVSEVMIGKRGTEKTIQNILDALSRLEVKQAEQKEAQA